MITKITNNIVDNRLSGRAIKRIDNYQASMVKINFQCLICENIWKSTPNSIFTGHGCPKCSDTRFSNEIIDIKLKNRNIKRIDDYINSKTKIRFQCLNIKCNYIWLSKTENLCNLEKGCPKCAGNARLTNDDIDLRLLHRKIKRIGNYINAKIYIEFECIVCNNIWKAAPDDVCGSRSNGCAKCKASKNENLMFEMLDALNITYIREYNVDLRVGKRQSRVDCYVPSLNLIIEYNGAQHYELVRFGGISIEKSKIAFEKQIIRDNALQQYCQNNNINLLEIDGRIYQGTKLKNFLIEYFK